jgi:hypothetical protein
LKIGSISKGVKVSSTQTREHNEVCSQFLQAQRRTDPTFVKWEADVKNKALPSGRAATVRNQFQQRITRPADVQAMLDEIAQKLAQ